MSEKDDWWVEMEEATDAALDEGPPPSPEEEDRGPTGLPTTNEFWDEWLEHHK